MTEAMEAGSAQEVVNSATDRRRVILTTLWLVAAILAIASVWLYTLRRTPDGVVYLESSNLFACLEPLLVVYGVYLGGMVLFWFGGTVVQQRPSPDRVRFLLALVLSVVFNVLVLAGISRYHFSVPPDANLLDAIADSVRISKAASWMVAPMLAYYFGRR